MLDIISAALSGKKCLEISYDGFKRLVEVHAYGITSEGNEVIRVWQVSGGSASNERSGWKLLRVDEAQSINLSGVVSEAPRQGYRSGDKAMTQIYCEV